VAALRARLAQSSMEGPEWVARIWGARRLPRLSFGRQAGCGMCWQTPYGWAGQARPVCHRAHPARHAA